MSGLGVRNSDFARSLFCLPPSILTVMNLLPFGQLPPYKPRRFAPATIDLGEWGQIAPLFDRLEASAPQAATCAQLEQWLLDWGEFTAALDEESSRRHIAMTCHTESAEAEQAFLHYVEKIEPLLKPRQFKLAQIYLAHPARASLPQARYRVFDRDLQVQVELFRAENIPLETEEVRLGQQYQKLSGSLTVQFQGEERTLVQMGRHQEDTDRAVRQEAWQLVVGRRLQEREQFDEVFDQMVELRARIAANAGFPNYLEFTFRQRGRFDYTPEDCRRFHDTIEQHVMPLLRDLHARRRQGLRLPALRPWDLAVDPLSRPPLRPFQQIEQMVDGAQRIFGRLDRGLGLSFRQLQELHLLDLDNRKGKAPGGYQSTLSEARLPFIFMNAVGLQRDVETILHEAGHAFHSLAARDEDLHAYRSAPIEFCEVASMSMELLGQEYLEEFYDPDEVSRARRNHLEGIITVFPWVATVDAFQHWVYTHPGHTRADRRAAWLALMDRFEGEVDWSGFEEARASLWHRQLHIFLHPFYYIEYAIAQLGALQVWANSKQDKAQALRQYQQALALGGSRSLPELFVAAGCRFAFDAETVKPLVDSVKVELDRLD
jgi:oligoendopeptidase F